jgi:transcriptional regulator with XRE-family HTH domain
VIRGKTIKAIQLRNLLCANIKVRRRKLGLTQEKLAEFTELSVQMINTIEGCRAWVSDKTLVVLAEVLGVEVYQLFIPVIKEETTEQDRILARRLGRLKQELKTDINADIEARFAPLIRSD